METQRYIIRERVVMSDRHKDFLSDLRWRPYAARLNARSKVVLIRKGYMTGETVIGPRGGKSRKYTLTAKGVEIVRRINDECEGVTSNGDYVFIVDKLPEGVVDGMEVDGNTGIPINHKESAK